MGMTIRTSVLLTALATVLTAGCGSQPVADSSTTRPVAAVTQAPLRIDPRDAAPAVPVVFHVEMFLLSFPQGAYSDNEDFWKRINEQCVDPDTYDLLYMNGLRMGVAPLAELEHFKKFIADIAPLQNFGMTGTDMRDVQLPMRKDLPYQRLFHYNRHHELIGRDFKASENLLNIAFEPALRKYGALRLTICPMVRATQKRLDYTALNNAIEIDFVYDQKIFDLNCKADIPLDHFLIITPSADAWRPTSIGNAFMVKDANAEKREQVLLVIPRAYKVETGQKQP
jgi:hypothetical protein